jgi:hypothetical protein
LAWRQAVQRVQLPHEWHARQIWRDRHGHGLLSDPVYRGWWEAAYERKPGPDQLVGVLVGVLEDRERAEATGWRQQPVPTRRRVLA